jgi:hypothetical protein
VTHVASIVIAGNTWLRLFHRKPEMGVKWTKVDFHLQLCLDWTFSFNGCSKGVKDNKKIKTLFPKVYYEWFFCVEQFIFKTPSTFYPCIFR